MFESPVSQHTYGMVGMDIEMLQQGCSDSTPTAIPAIQGPHFARQRHVMTHEQPTAYHCIARSE